MRFAPLFAAALGLFAAPAVAQVERVKIDESAFSLGTLTPSEGALPQTLWRGSERNAISDLLVTVPTEFDEPLQRELLRRVLLSPGEGPRGADSALAGQKLLKAAHAGWYQDASQLASLSPVTNSEPALSRAIAYQELMDGQVDTACARGEALRDGRAAPFWIKLRFICYVRAGEASAAELTLNLLRRQEVLTSLEDIRYTAFADGKTIAISQGQPTVFDWVMLRESGGAVDASILSRADAALTAAIARADGVDPKLRETALTDALRERTITADEALTILDNLGTTPLATDYLTLTAVPPESLELSEAIGAALRRGGNTYEAFEPRARLFASRLQAARPITNYAPNATEIILAAMITDQREVSERWLAALLADQTRPAGAERATRLVQAYGLIAPQQAERMAAVMGLPFDPLEATPIDPVNAAPSVPVNTLVAAALPAAEAGSQGPAALIYLTSVATREDGQGGIRDAVKTWARDRAGLDWMDRQAAFRAEVSALLSEPPLEVVDVPDPKPAVINPAPVPAN